MIIYIDEAGNTGVSALKRGKLNFASQPVFAMGMLLINDEKDRKELLEKYREFKKKFNITGEIKGSELMTRKRNDELNFLQEHFFDSKHFKVNLYDKKFYISTLLLRTFFNNDFFYNDPVKFYQQASFLALEDNRFFEEYCGCVANVSENSFKDYLSFLSNFNYTFISDEQNILKHKAINLLAGSDNDIIYTDLYLFDDRHTELFDCVNLNAFIETVTWLKNFMPISNAQISFIHDEISEFEGILKETAKENHITLSFEKSEENECLQMVDNITSILLHLFVNVRKYFQNTTEWKEESEWLMTTYASMQNILTEKNIKYTIPIQDWALSLCVKRMFAPSFPKSQRRNIYFKPMYYHTQEYIYKCILNGQEYMPHMDEVLKR